MDAPVGQIAQEGVDAVTQGTRKLTKVQLIGLLVGIVFLAGMSVAVGKERAGRIRAETRWVEAQTKYNTLKAQVEEIGQIREDLQAKLDELQTLTQQVAQERAQRVALEQTLAERDEQIFSLASSVETLRQKLQSMTSVHTHLRQKLQRLSVHRSGAVELEKIVIQARPNLEGRVLAVNPEYQVIVLGLGRRDGLETGAVLSIHRGNNLIGRVRVEDVYETVSTAAPLPQWQWVDIQEDDLAREL